MALKPYPKRRGTYASSKQVAILKALVKRNTDGSALDTYQLIERTAPGTSRTAMVCSLRHLAGHALIAEAGKETRRARSMMTYIATAAGALLVRPGKLP